MIKEQRRKTMQAIKAKSKLEDVVSKELWRRGFRFRKNVRGMQGTPDIAFKNIKWSYSSILVFGIIVRNMGKSQKATSTTGRKSLNETGKEIGK